MGKLSSFNKCVIAPSTGSVALSTTQQAVLVKVTHEPSFFWQAIVPGRTRKKKKKSETVEHNQIITRFILVEEEVALSKICTGNSKDYALLRGVNGSGMSIMAH
ncbi:hypothetical protein GOODEAATRI_010791 [Goodea atripinnis]|uniref:Uncharacterized protein n=1 Tax=Goodea atripinnis TaxID=208336 RepID=A0ABV0PWZ8_9TELE